MDRPAPRPAPPPAPRAPKAPPPVDDDAPTAKRPSAPSVPPPPPEAEAGFPEPAVKAARQLTAVCEAELRQDPPAREAGRLHYEIARLAEGPLQDLRVAAAHYQKALELLPDHLPTIRGARRVLLTRRSYQSALELFDREVRITADPARKAALLHAKGRILEDVLGKKKEASEAYAHALDLDRANPAILRSLAERHAEEKAWDALERVLEKAANAVSDDPRHRATLVAARARLVERHGDAPERATELWETALRLDPRAPGALAALKRLHHAQRRWRDLIRVLGLEAELTEDDGVRTMALYRVGRLHAERLGNRNEALAALEKAHGVAPDDPLILGELARLYEQAGRWDALAETLQSLVQTMSEPRERIALLHRIGDLYVTRLQREDAAAHWYQSALRVDPTHTPTLQALAPILAKHGEHEALVAMHLAEAEATKEAERRAAAHARVAEILETQLDRKSDAMEHHAKALGIVPLFPASFKALTRLYAEAGKFRELIELHERAVDGAAHTTLAIAHLFKIGAVYEDLLDEPAHAAQTFQRILELDPDHLGAIHALQRAAERAGRYRDLVKALELEADKSDVNAHVVALLHRAGEVLLEQLSDRRGALEHFTKVLELDATYAPVLASLGRLHHAAGRWDDLLGIYEKELELSPRGPAAVVLRQKMGDLCSERLGREDDALEHYRKALELDATYGPALKALTRRLRERGEWAALVDVLEKELGGLDTPTAKARQAYRIGEVHEEELDDPKKALRAYERALEALPAYRPALDALARLRAREAAWGALAQGLGREAEATADPMLSVDAQLRQATLWAQELDEPRKAIGALEAVLEREPTHLGALLALEGLYRRVGAWEALAKVYAAEARVFVDAAARVAALEAQAQVMLARKLGTPAELASVWERVLDVDPTHRGALEGLEAVALEMGSPERLVEVDRRLTAIAEDEAVRAAHVTRLGESLEASGGDGALDAFREALRHDPSSLAATRGLARIAAKLDDPTVLAEAARKQAELAKDPAAVAHHLVESAEVRTDRLGDVEGALSDLERALEVHPDSEEAAHWLGRILRARGEHARLADLLARAAGAAEASHRASALWLAVAELQAEELQNLPSAIASLARVVRQTPNHVPTLRRLADYYARDGQWAEAAEHLTRLVQLAPDQDVLLKAHLDLARIWAEELGDGSRALVSLQAVLTVEPRHAEALTQLAELHEREGRTGEAAETAHDLLGAFPDAGPGRAAALVRLARLERARENDAAAAEALREAVAIEGPGSESALECKALTDTTAGWNQYVSALEKHLAGLQPGDAAPTYLELGRVIYDQLERPQEAIAALEQGADATGDATVQRELALRLRMAGLHDRAIEALRRLAAANLTRADTWRELSRTHLEVGQRRAARVAIEPLRLLGGMTEREQSLLRQEPPTPAAARAGTFGPLLDRLGTPTPEQKAAGDLLRSLEPALAKLYPPDLESYGLGSRDKLTTKSGHPLKQLADRIASIIGVESYEIFEHRVRSRGMGLELGSPAMILVPATVAELPLPQQVFLLARPLVHVARGFQAVDKLTPRELEVLLASAARNVREGYGRGLTSEEFLNDQAKRLYKALGRRHRKGMEEAARAYVEVGRVDFPRWTFGARRTAYRVAALLADDLWGVTEVLRRTEANMQNLEGAALLREAEPVADLVAFWASRAAMHVRQHAGLLG
ncbi:MAG: hypothetical protein CMN29_29340 [Sandaracinus sp.]|nr:hypothetical protein [Sandaracinus sp.]